MKNYLVPMWSYKNKQIKNHLAFINGNGIYGCKTYSKT